MSSSRRLFSTLSKRGTVWHAQPIECALSLNPTDWGFFIYKGVKLGSISSKAVDWDAMQRETTNELIERPRAALDWLRFQHKWSVGGWLFNSFVDAGVCEMARGKGVGARKSADAKGGWTQFVDISLVGVEVETLMENYATADQVYDAVAGLIEDGYRLSLVYNAQNDAIICSLTCRDEGSVNAGLTFNSFADTWWDAIRVALVKHFEVAKGTWTPAAGKVTRNRYG